MNVVIFFPCRIVTAKRALRNSAVRLFYCWTILTEARAVHSRCVFPRHRPGRSWRSTNCPFRLLEDWGETYYCWSEDDHIGKVVFENHLLETFENSIFSYPRPEIRPFFTPRIWTIPDMPYSNIVGWICSVTIRKIPKRRGRSKRRRVGKMKRKSSQRKKLRMMTQRKARKISTVKKSQIRNNHLIRVWII